MLAEHHLPIRHDAVSVEDDNRILKSTKGLIMDYATHGGDYN